MVVETLLSLAAAGSIGAAGLAYMAKRKVFPRAPSPDEDHFVLPIKLLEADAEDITSRYVKGVRIPRRTLLTLGTSGAGKSETLKHFADDLRADPDSQIVVYDHKDDYSSFFEERGADMIRLSSGVRGTRTGMQSRGISLRRSRPRRTPTSSGAHSSPRVATSGPTPLDNCSRRR